MKKKEIILEYQLAFLNFQHEENNFDIRGFLITVYIM